MANKISWKTFFAGAGSAIIAMAALIGAIDVVKNWSSRAKPQVLEAQQCAVTIRSKTIGFELLVNNPDSKDCSIISIDLLELNGVKADLDLDISLPKTIPAGQTNRIGVVGNFRSKLELQPDQKTTEGIVEVKFNTNDIIKKCIIFTLCR